MKHDQLRHLRNLRLLLSQDKSPVAFLLSAGCPLSIKNSDGSPLLPDMNGLTSLVKKKHEQDTPDSPYNKLQKELTAASINSSNLEDVLSFIRSMKAVSSGGEVRGFSEDELTQLENDICETIIDAVSKELPKEDNSYRFLAEWVKSIDRRYPIEIFTTNYDLLTEQALEDANVPFFDGFSGSRYPFFDVHSVETDDLPSYWARLWKLHGSINWCFANDNVCRLTKGEKGSPELIYPSKLKYDQSRKMPFLAMSDRLTTFLSKPHSILVTCGYSFGDEHINDTIVHALKVNPSANVIALMYGSLGDNENNATKLAKGRPNLSVWYDDKAIINTQNLDWNEFNDDKNEFAGFDFEIKDKRVSLGDFKSFTSFLNHLTGDEHNS